MMNSFATSVSIALQYGVPLETLVRKFAYMRFEPEGITTNPEIPFAKSMPDYFMRWLASRFLDADIQEELGIRTDAVRHRQNAQDVVQGGGDTARPVGSGNGAAGTGAAVTGAAGTVTPPAGKQAPLNAATDTPPVVPARVQAKGPDIELGPVCGDCGGMMQRTGACYTCSSCGNNTGCG
jgi:ribonucleoside-diphosphate reductase alpha chain